MTASKGWRGYISSREIDGSMIPQRVQNLVIRNYANSREMLYLLSATEYYMDDCYMMLDALIHELGTLAGVIFYSTHMLPPSEAHRRRLYESAFKAGCDIHFALEEIVIRTEHDAKALEDVIMCRVLSQTKDGVKLDADRN